MSERDRVPEGAQARRSLVVVNQGGFKLGERLTRHWSAPNVVAHQKGAPASDLPAEAEVLVTQQHLWTGLARPHGWPFGLKFIQVLTTGVDLLPPWFFEGPLVACSRGIPSVPIAEFVLALILAHEKDLEAIRVHDRAQWAQKMLGTLTGKVLGLAGFGAIGRAVAIRAAGFGMDILALRRTQGAAEPGVRFARDFNALVAEADHLVLAMPLTAQTRLILNAGALALAKPTLHVMNVARGGLIDDDALLAALDEGRIAAASLDVTEPEPPPPGHPYYSHPKVRLTPHISWSDKTSADRLNDKIIANFEHYLRGEPVEDIVDPVRGY
jgi:phosphoglycerate dehydrogenase-like enzyme